MRDSILLTGGAGFIGSNFINYFLDKYENYKLINLDNLSYASDLSNLKYREEKYYKFIKGDICDNALVSKIFKEQNIKHIIHFAAQSHVDNSIKNPAIFVKTNVEGTFNLLDLAYNFWFDKPFLPKENFQNSKFYHISTDEVYGSIKKGLFTESTPYAPNSPYSASKASSDFLLRAYNKTFGLNTLMTNCSNNYGPAQHEEKFIPLIIKNCLKKKDIPVYGDGKNIRDWLFVEDHCRAIDLVFHKGKIGESYNIGSRNEKDNNFIVNTICEILDELSPSSRTYKEQITYVKDRYGHDRRYAIDPSKIEKELGFKSLISFKEGLIKTVKWYLTKWQS